MSHGKQTLEAPAVPLFATPGLAYDRLQVNDTQNSIRQFFIKLSNGLRNLFGPLGVQYLDQPNLLAFSTSTQTLAAANTGYAVTFPTTYLSNGVSVVSSSRLTVTTPGVYNFNITTQLESTNASTKHVWLWLKRSGTTIGYSTRVYTVAGSGTHLVAEWVFNIDMAANDYMEVFWASDSTTVQMVATAATSPHPGIPSAVASVCYVGRQPHDLPTPP